MSRKSAVTASEFSAVEGVIDVIDGHDDKDIHAEVRLEFDSAGEVYPSDVLSSEVSASDGDESVDLGCADLRVELDTAQGRRAEPAIGTTPTDPDLAESVSAADLKTMSDEALLAGIRNKSEAHFAEIYNRYFQRIYSFVYTRMRNHAETEEVVQETFLAVFRSFDRYRGQSSLLSWIYGIAKNTANSSIRRARSLNERIDLADDEDLMPRPSLDVGTPSEQLDLNRFRDQLAQRLESLSDWQTEIFEMRHFENLSIPEISRRTTRSSDAVRSSLYRVKRLFFEAAEASNATGLAVGDPS